MAQTLEEYCNQIKQKRCPCGAGLDNIKPENIQHYDHPCGYEVKGYEKKQWLYEKNPYGLHENL